MPGFIDVHVHGVEGQDTLTTANAVAEIARRLPRYGVTGFCPTTVACGPAELRHLLDGIARRGRRRSGAARTCCRRTWRATSSRRTSAARSRWRASDARPPRCCPARPPEAERFSGDDILAVIA